MLVAAEASSKTINEKFIAAEEVDLSIAFEQLV